MKPWFKCESIFAPLILRQQNFLHLIIFRSEATEAVQILPRNLESTYYLFLNSKTSQIFAQVKIHKNFWSVWWIMVVIRSVCEIFYVTAPASI